MSDSDPLDLLPPADDSDSGALSRVRSLARRGRRGLARLARRQLQEAGDRLYDELREFLSSPRRVQRLQRVLARVASWSMQRGFETDPNAGLLFEFVDWLEHRHGRPAIAAILFRSPLVGDPEFLEALGHLSRVYGPWRPTDDDRWDHQDVERFKRRAGDRLLDLLVRLAALESDESPPEGPVERKIEFFEQAELPARFTRLAAMTRGRDLLDPATPTERFEWARRLIDRLPGSAGNSGALRPFVPGTGDDTLHFLVFSTSFFYQSYLVRHLIEGLPQLAERLDRQLDDDEPIDID